MCRKNYGLYGAFIAVPNENLTLGKGAPIRWYSSSKEVRRGFCRICGSPVVWKKKGSTHTFVLAGLIDGKVGKKKVKHIFTEEKGDYYTIPK